MLETLKLTVPPTATVWFVGAVVMNGGKNTIKVATLLVTLP